MADSFRQAHEKAERLRSVVSNLSRSSISLVDQGLSYGSVPGGLGTVVVELGRVVVDAGGVTPQVCRHEPNVSRQA